MDVDTTYTRPEASPKQEKASKTRSSKTRSSSSSDRQESGLPEFDPKLIWVTIRRCWAWATPTGLALGALAMFVVYSNFVPIYQATHLLSRIKTMSYFKM